MSRAPSVGIKQCLYKEKMLSARFAFPEMFTDPTLVKIQHHATCVTIATCFLVR